MDNTVNVKVVGETGQASQAFENFSSTASTQLDLFGASATTAFAAVDKAGATMAETVASLAPALGTASKAIETVGLNSINAAGQMNLFGQISANSLTYFTYAAQTVQEEGQKIPTILEKIVAWFKNVGSSALDMAGKVKEGSVLSTEAVQGFAANATVSAAAVKDAFSILGGIFAAFAAGQIFSDWINKAKETVDAMGDLSVATGVTVTELVELRDVFLATGEPVNTIERIFPKLIKAMEGARTEGSKQAEAFRLLGVNTKGWHDELPPAISVVQQVSSHLANSTNAIQDAANAQVIFGKSIAGVVSSLSQVGDKLQDNMDKFKEHGQAVEAAGAAADKLIYLEAELSTKFQTLAVDVLPGVVTAFQVVSTVGRAVVIIIQEIVNAVIFLTSEIDGLIIGLAKSMYSLVTGDFKGAANQAKETFQMAQVYGKVFADRAKEDWQEGWKAIKETWEQPLPPAKQSGATNEDLAPVDDSKARQAQAKTLEGQRAHELALLSLQKDRYDQEEKLGQISSQANLSRLLTNQAAETAIKQEFNEKLLALAQSDPNGSVQVQELMNKRQAIIDSGYSAELKLRQKVTLEQKKLADDLERTYIAMINAIASEEEKAAKKLEAFNGKILEEGRATADKGIEDASRAAALKTTAEEKHAQNVLELQRKRIEDEYNLGIISLGQRDALLRASFDKESKLQSDLLTKELTNLDAHNQQYLAKRNQLMERIQATGNIDEKDSLAKELSQLDGFNTTYLSKRQELNDKVQALTDRSLQQQQQAEATHLKKITQGYQAFINTIGQAFTQNVMGLIKGTETFGEAFMKTLGDILTGFIGTLVQMGVKWAERQLLDLVLHQSTNAAKAASDTAAAATQTATGSAAAASNIAQLAGVAAAATFASIAAIPIVGPELAGPAAAASLATVLGFEGLAFAEQGGIMPSDQLLFAHKNEMVLPAHIAQGVQAAFSPGGNGDKSDSGGGDYHYHAPSFQVMDATGIDTVLTKHRDEFIRHAKTWNRQGHLA